MGHAIFSSTESKPPKIYSMTSNVTRQEGKRVRLVCKVQGEPPPKVTWFKDKRSINRNVTKYAQVHLKCPKGFSGNKCENKVIDYHPTTSSKHQDCSYGYGYGGYYC
ncbi:hypothetical protein RP20_CCG013605 [Aedes albopictus]|nr:hypothetical protein RP20_CCG013605 [Aedes albopictus]